MYCKHFYEYDILTHITGCLWAGETAEGLRLSTRKV